MNVKLAVDQLCLEETALVNPVEMVVVYCKQIECDVLICQLQGELYLLVLAFSTIRGVSIRGHW